ncbi:DNA ligase, partial [bacterium]|nr:DNA ligase [bacterium]
TEIEIEVKQDVPTPLTPLEEGDSIKVQGSGTAEYEVRLRGGNYYCTCPAWRNKGGSTIRSCKHLKKVLGVEFEAWRVGTDIGAAPLFGKTKKGGKKTKKAGAKPFKTSPPPLILAHKWDEDKHNPTGWFISEKYDGLRAFWNGTMFLSRQGNQFCAPKYFTDDLPTDCTLDGELYMGRKRFEETSGIVRTQNFQDPRWHDIKFMVFDVPSMGDQPFEQRIAHMHREFRDHTFLRVVEHWKAKSKQDVIDQRDKICEADAEGLMLRRPNSLYSGGRTNDLLKVKVWHDLEAFVTGHQPGKGKHTGRLGALECRLATDPATRRAMAFKVGTGFNDAQRENPPAIGTIVTIKYQELSKGGCPRFPVYLRVAERQEHDLFFEPDPPATKKTKTTKRKRAKRAKRAKTKTKNQTKDVVLTD